ncbi:MAG: DNA replication/repair protein RecF, partial [Candidatus Kryptoniota bacterium]
FCNGANFIVGANAQGKTSILEAISYICITKSFLRTGDINVVKSGADSFVLDSDIESISGRLFHVAFRHDAANGKKYVINGSPISRASDVVGKFPIIVLSPDNFGITGGPPSDRRKFLDMVLSQTSHAYLEELSEYQKVLKQRNRVLQEKKLGRQIDNGSLRAWTEGLVERGSRIILRRHEFTEEFKSDLKRVYLQIGGEREEPDLSYRPSFEYSRVSSIQEEFLKAIDRSKQVELSRCATLVGPHRDDITFYINGMPLQRFASQGQHKTFLVALKIAEFFYMKRKTHEIPIMLLDDVMTELDYVRSSKFAAIIGQLGQSFITMTDAVTFDTSMI